MLEKPPRFEIWEAELLREGRGVFVWQWISNINNPFAESLTLPLMQKSALKKKKKIVVKRLVD